MALDGKWHLLFVYSIELLGLAGRGAHVSYGRQEQPARRPSTTERGVWAWMGTPESLF
jgi:hypothetical protein